MAMAMQCLWPQSTVIGEGSASRASRAPLTPKLRPAACAQHQLLSEGIVVECQSQNIRSGMDAVYGEVLSVLRHLLATKIAFEQLPD